MQLLQNCPDVKFIQSGANLGFAGGNNVGIHFAMEQGADYIWLLNNDAVADPLALSALIEALETNPAAAIAGSKIYYRDDPQRIWSAGGSWSKGNLRLRQRGAGQIDTGQFDQPCPVDSVSGCSLLIRVSEIEKIGLLDESYFLYWEDIDWCARAEAAGCRVLYVPNSQVWHWVSASAAQRSRLQYYYYTRNGLTFCSRHDRRSLPLLLLYTGADAVIGLTWGNTDMMAGFCLGITDFLRGCHGRWNRS
jgi:GT2 family glycosyltransferase